MGDFSLTVAEHLLNLGEYLLNAAGHCGPTHLFHKGTHCGSAVVQVASALTEIASGGSKIAGYCAQKPNLSPAPVPTLPVPTPVPVPVPVPAPRLYSDEIDAHAEPSSVATPLNAVLVALLPITSIAAFFGGSRFQRSSARRTQIITPDQLIE